MFQKIVNAALRRDGRDRSKNERLSTSPKEEQVQIDDKVEDTNEEIPIEPMVEVVFSDDEDGNILRELWDQVEGTEVNRTPRWCLEEGTHLLRELKSAENEGKKWEIIESSLVGQYSAEVNFWKFFNLVYDTGGANMYSGAHFANNARESLSTEKLRVIEPHSCYTCFGHPSEMVIHIAEKFEKYFRSHEMDDEYNVENTLTGTIYKFQFRSRMDRRGSGEYHSIYLSDRLNWPELSDQLVLKIEKFHMSNLLEYLKVLSLIVLWPHNRQIIISKVNKHFPSVLIHVLSLMVDEIEDFCLTLGNSSSFSVQGTSSDNDGNGSDDDTNDYIRVILNALLYLVHILVRCHRTEHEPTPSVDDFLPSQPWNTDALFRTGFDIYGQEVHETAEEPENSLREGQEIKPKDHPDGDSVGDSLGSFSIDFDMEDDGEQPDNTLDGDLQAQPWAKPLLEAGSIEVLCRGLSALSTMHSKARDKSRNDLMASVTVLEIEILHALRVHLHHSKSELCFAQFHTSKGPTALENLLSRPMGYDSDEYSKRAVGSARSNDGEGNCDQLQELRQSSFTTLIGGIGNTSDAEGVFHPHQNLFLRRGILCFAIVDYVCTTACALNYANEFTLPLSEACLADFLGSLRSLCDNCHIGDKEMMDLRAAVLSLSYKTSLSKSHDICGDIDLWPWSADPTNKAMATANEIEVTSHFEGIADTHEGKAAANAAEPVAERPTILSTKVSSSIENVRGDFEDFHIVSIKTTSETSSMRRRQSSPVVSDNVWHWCTRSRGALIWHYFFGAIFRILCQGRGFKTVRDHCNSFCWVVQSVCEYFLRENVLALGSDRCLPLMQINFVNFLSTVLSSDMQTTLALLADTDVWRVLDGPLFLFGGKNCIHGFLDVAFECKEVISGETSKVSYTYKESLAKEPHEEEGAERNSNTQDNDEDGDGIVRAESGMRVLAWAILHDRILEFASTHLHHSFMLVDDAEGSSAPLSSSTSPLSQVDEMKIAVIRAVTNCISACTPDNQPRSDFCADSVAYSGIRWLHFALNKYPWSEELYVSLWREIVVKVMALISVQAYRHQGVLQLKTTSFTYDHNANLFLWPSRSVTLEFFVNLTSGLRDASHLLSLVHHEHLLDVIEVGLRNDRAATASVATNQSRSRSNSGADSPQGIHRKSPAKGNEIILERVESNLSAHAGAGSRVQFVHRSYEFVGTNQVHLLLLDPYARVVAMNFIFKVIMACCKLVDTDVRLVSGQHQSFMRGTPSGITKAEYERIRMVLKVTIVGMMDVVGNGMIYHPRHKGYDMILYVLKTMTWMLREPSFANNQYVLQTACYYPFDKDTNTFAFQILDLLRRVGKSCGGEPEMANTMLSIFKQGVALLTALTVSPSDGPPNPNMTNLGLELRKARDSLSVTLQAEPVPSMETIVVMLEMMLGESLGPAIHLNTDDPSKLSLYFSEKDLDQLRIVNRHVVPVVLQMIRHCHRESQLAVLEVFDRLLSSGTSRAEQNLEECHDCYPSVFELLLENIIIFTDDDVHEANILLLKKLGRHKVMVTHLKRMFKIMMSDSHDKHKLLEQNSRAIEALKGMLGEVSGPRVKFQFQGIRPSGIQLPEIVRWPGTKGFSFSTWLSLDTLSYQSKMSSSRKFTPLKANRQKYRPCILSIIGLDGSGLEVHLTQSPHEHGKYQLVFDSFDDENQCSSVQIQEAPMELREREWHFFAFSLFQKNSTNNVFGRDKGSNSLVVYVDHQRVEREFPYPRCFSSGGSTKPPTIGDSAYYSATTSSMSHDNIGTGALDGSLSARMTTKLGYNSCFRGQMGAVYFFSGELNDVQVRSIRALGHDYFYCFEPINVEDDSSGMFLKADQTIFQENHVHGLQKLVFAAYNPAVFQGDQLLDNADRKSGGRVFWRRVVPSDSRGSSSNAIANADDLDNSQTMPARMMANTLSITIQNVKSALDSLAGVKVLTPMLFRMHLIGGDISRMFDPWLQLLFTYLRIALNTDGRGNKMYELNCYRIGSLMEYLSLKQGFSLQALKTLFDIHSFLSDQQIFLEVQEKLVEHILLNCRIWVHSSLDVQTFLYDWCFMYLQKNPNSARALLSPARLIHQIYLTFDYVCYDTPEAVKELEAMGCLPYFFIGNQSMSKTNREVSVAKPTGRALQQIRQRLFTLLECLLENGLKADEVTSILQYMALTRSTIAKCEYLMVLLHLLLDEKTQSKTLLAFIQGHGALLVVLSSSRSENLRERVLGATLLSQLYALACEHRNPRAADILSLRREVYNVLSSYLIELESQAVKVKTSEDLNEHGSAALDTLEETPADHMELAFVAYLLLRISHGSTVEYLLQFIPQTGFLEHLKNHAGGEISERNSSKDAKVKGFDEINAQDVIGGQGAILLPVALELMLSLLRNRSFPLETTQDILDSLRPCLVECEDLFSFDQMVALKYLPLYVMDIRASLHINNGSASSVTERRQLVERVDQRCLLIFQELCLYVLSIGMTLRKAITNREQAIAELQGRDLDHQKEYTEGSRVYGALFVRKVALQMRAYCLSGTTERRLKTSTHSTSNLNANLDLGADILHILEVTLNHLVDAIKSDLNNGVLESKEPWTSESSIEYLLPENTRQITALKIHLVNVRVIVRTLLDVVSPYLFQYPWTDAPHDARIPSDDCPPKEIWRIVRRIFEIDIFRDILSGYDVGFEMDKASAASTNVPEEAKSADVGGDVPDYPSPRDVWLNIQATALGIRSRGGVMWSLVRILCHIIVQSNLQNDVTSVRENEERQGQGPYWYHALEALQALLQHGLECGMTFMDRELYHVLACLSETLCNYKTDLCVFSGKVTSVLKLLSVLVMHRRLGLVGMLREMDKARADDKCTPRVISTPYIRTYKILIDEVSAALVPQMDPDESVHMTTAESDIVQLVANLDIEKWQALMSAIQEQSKFTHATINMHEREAFALKDVTPVTATRIVAGTDAESSSITFEVPLSHSKAACDDKKNAMRTNCLMQLRSFFKTLTVEKDKRDRDIDSMLSKLEYERGPWFGLKTRLDKKDNTEINDVHWSLDFAETDVRTRLLLQRNESANTHRRASQIQQRKGQKDVVVTQDDRGSEFQGDSDFRKQILRFIAEPASLEEPELEEEEGAPEQEKDGDKFVGKRASGEANPEFGKTMLDTIKIFADDDHVTFSAPCEIVTVVTNSEFHARGSLEIQGKRLIYRSNDEEKFTNDTENDEFLWALEQYGYAITSSSNKQASPRVVLEWNTGDLHQIFECTFQMRKVAVELSFINRKSFLFAFCDKSTMRKFTKKLVSARPRQLVTTFLGGSGADIVHRQHPKYGKPLQEAWIRREISNFEYILELNRLAGRSFNDLSQYPIFPWVLKDYRSEELDLNDPNVYRDLRWPIGAQDPKVRKTMMASYQAAMEDPDSMMPIRHAGGHYSQPNTVLYYLIRMEPFTSLHVWFQGGKFDHADRLFRSVAETYEMASGPNYMDVKELIPEFYCNPEFLRNINNISLGTTQAGVSLGPVELPPWAISAHDFVSKMRSALESEYVSANLHHWIDLIFGNKSVPPGLRGGNTQTVERCNVFEEYHYPGAYNLEQMRIDDAALFDVTVKKITEFGQNPVCLFPNEDHPRRNLLIDSTRYSSEHLSCNIIWKFASSVEGYHTIFWLLQELQNEQGKISDKDKRRLRRDKPRFCQCFTDEQVSTSPILFIGEIESKKTLVTLDLNRILGSHPFEKRSRDTNPPHSFTVDKVLQRALDGQRYRSSNVSSMIKAGIGVITDMDQKAIGVPFAVWGIKSGSWGRGGPMGQAYDGIFKGTVGARGDGMVADTTGPVNKNYVKRLERGRQERGKKLKSDLDKTLERVKHQKTSIDASRSPLIKQPIPFSPSEASVVPTAGSLERIQSLESSPVSTSKNAKNQDVGRQSLAGNRIRDTGDAREQQNVEETGSMRKYDAKANKSRKSQKEGEYEFGDLPARPVSLDSGSRRKKDKDRERTPLTQADSRGYRSPKNMPPHHLSPHLFALLPQYKLFFSCGYYDSTFRVDNVDTNRRVQTLRQHSEVVTCLAIASDLGQHWLVTGSKDCTLIVWEVLPERNTRPVNPIALTTIRGHDDVINCVAVNPELNLIVSGSDDGTMMLHTLRDFTYIRNIQFNQVPRDAPLARSKSTLGSARVNMVLISAAEALIIAYSCDGNFLHTYSLNSMDIPGPLKSIGVYERLHSMILSEDGKVLLTGGTRCLVVLRWARTLMVANTGPREHLEAIIDGRSQAITGTDGKKRDTMPFDSPIRSLYLTAMEQQLVVGLESGRVRILSQDNKYMNDRLRNQLLVTGYFQ